MARELPYLEAYVRFEGQLRQMPYRALVNYLGAARSADLVTREAIRAEILRRQKQRKTR